MAETVRSKSVVPVRARHKPVQKLVGRVPRALPPKDDRFHHAAILGDQEIRSSHAVTSDCRPQFFLIEPSADVTPR